MSRIIKHDAKQPFEIKPSEKSTWVCVCGLSKKFPLCDGSHKQCADEEDGKLYVYNNGVRVEAK